MSYRLAATAVALTLLAGTGSAGPRPLRTVKVDPKGAPLERGNALRHQIELAKARRKDPLRITLGAGDYDLAEAGLTVPPWVEIHGQGPQKTRLYGVGGASRQAVVRLRGPASLAGLGVEARQGTFATALEVTSGEARLLDVHVRSDGARWGGRAIVLSPGARARLARLEVTAVATGQGAATALELGARAQAEVDDGILRVEADGGPAIGFSLGPDASLTVQGGSAHVDASRGEVRGLHAGPNARARLHGFRLDTRGGRFHHALDLAGDGAHLEMVASRVEARDGSLATTVLTQTGADASSRFQDSELKVAVPGYPKLAVLGRRAGRLELDEARLLGGRPAVEAADHTRISVRCSDLDGGVLAGPGVYRCFSCTGAPVACDATRSRTRP